MHPVADRLPDAIVPDHDDGACHASWGHPT